MIFVSKKYIYGIDVSMSNTGISIFNLDTSQPVLVTSIATNSKYTYGVRLHTIRNYIKDLIKQYKPYEVAIEQGFSKFNTSTQVSYRVHGVIQELLKDYPQFYYPPKTIKSIITGNGNANKKLVQDCILKKYPNINFSNFDESDAMGVAICHLIKHHKLL
jgi:crossover junction endodeoxyribonuclease RuvC